MNIKTHFMPNTPEQNVPKPAPSKSISIFAVIAMFLAIQTSAQTLPEGTKIVYEKNDYVWSVNADTMIKNKLAKGNYPALTYKAGAPSVEFAQNEAAYILTKNNSHFDAKTDKEGIYIYNFLSDTTTYINYPVANTTNQLMWSPNGKYLLVGVHTSTFDTKTIINKSGKKFTSFKTIGNQFSWINSSNIAFTSLHDVNPDRPRSTGAGDGFGVSKINKFGKKTVLKAPNALTDYQFFGMTSDGKIKFIKYKVSAQDDWKYSSKIKKSYWTMGKGGKNAKKTAKFITWEVMIKEILPAKYQTYQIKDHGGLYTDMQWRLLIMNKTYNIENEEIYILHYPHADTLTKITKGRRPSWGWNLN